MDLFYWTKVARELNEQQLERLRKSAESWRNGLAGLTGLLTLLAVIKGPSSFSDLSADGRLRVGLALFLGFILLAIGMRLAMKASFGYPSEPGWLTAPEVKRKTIELVHKTARHLRAIGWLFFLGTLSIALAIVLTWIDKGAETRRPFIAVQVRGQASPICGEFEKSAGSSITLKVKNNLGQTESEEIDVGSLTAFNIVPDCAAVDTG